MSWSSTNSKVRGAAESAEASKKTGSNRFGNSGKRMRCTPPGRLMIQQGIAALRLAHGRWHEEERGEGGARARPDWRLGSRAEASQERLGGAAVRADVARPARGAPGAAELRHDRVDRRRASVRRAGPRGWHQRNGTGGRGWEAL